MRVKVIRAIMVYNGKTYHEGDYVVVENEEKRQKMVSGKSVVESQVTEKGINKSTEKTHYVPSGDAIEELKEEEKVKGKRGGRG